jgi:hypothetical protein
MIPREDEKEILKDLGLLANDRYTAVFYNHTVFDSDASFGDARQKAFDEAERKSIRLGREVEPDYSPKNLKALGAKEVYKDEVWVKIIRRGAKDNKSYKATDQHKQQFPEAWEQFERENENNRDIPERRQDIQSNSSRPQNPPQGIGFTPSEYTVTFG